MSSVIMAGECLCLFHLEAEISKVKFLALCCDMELFLFT